jgi:hypothetical protein
MEEPSKKSATDLAREVEIAAKAAEQVSDPGAKRGLAFVTRAYAALARWRKGAMFF